jgi:hypothetical protein
MAVAGHASPFTEFYELRLFRSIFPLITGFSFDFNGAHLYKSEVLYSLMDFVKFRVLAVASMKITVFLDVAPCSLVEITLTLIQNSSAWKIFTTVM